jgi:hypothetical protein
MRVVATGVQLAHFLGDLHRAEARPAHRAEVGDLGAVLRQRRVVVLARGLRIERKVELVLPAELEARLAERVVAVRAPGVALGEVGGVRGDLVGDDALLDVVAIGQARGAPSASRSTASRCRGCR